MILSLLLYLLLAWQSLLHSSFEHLYPFKWDSTFHSFVEDPARSQYRLAQVYVESGFNPRATSDFKGWKHKRIDTVTAIRRGMGAAGLCQFIFPTAQRYGALTITTSQADSMTYSTDMYNPAWGLTAMIQYVKSIDRIILATRNPKSRRKLLVDKKFRELCSSASYNTGEGRVLGLLNKDSDWENIRLLLPAETRFYAERIMQVGDAMNKQTRWSRTLR
jgi:soluble lytic murein transglycosylase-like protein